MFLRKIIIAAIEADDVETVRSIFEDSPSLQAAGVEPVAEFPDERAMRADNEYVAPALGTLLEEGQKALTLTLDDTPEKIWTGLVMSNLYSRLDAGENQTDVLRDLIEFSVLPVKGLDKQVLIDYANEYLPEELATNLAGIAEGMTERDVRATMWHINDVAAAMSYTDESVEGVHPLILFAVNCPESVVLHSQADVDAAVAAARFPQLDEFEENTFAVIEAGCSFFPPTEYIDSSFIEPVVSDVPALLLQGAMDTQTPLSGAEEMASYLENSQFVLFESEGHVVASKTDNCPGVISAQFLADPMSEVDASCAEEFVINFEVP